MEVTSKTLDAEPDVAFFLAIPRLQEKATNLSKQLSIITIEGKDTNEASEKVRQSLGEKGLAT